MSPPHWKVSNLLLGKSGRQLPEIMKPLGQSRNNAQLWMRLVVKVKSNAVKNNCIGTWNVRYMNQGKLEVVKQEMARVNHMHTFTHNES